MKGQVAQEDPPFSVPNMQLLTLDHLKTHGFQTAYVVHPNGDLPYVVHNDRRVVLFEFLRGESPSVDSVTLGMLEQLGGALASLHSLPAVHAVPSIDEGGCMMIGEAATEFEKELLAAGSESLAGHPFVVQLRQTLPRTRELLHLGSVPHSVIHTDLFPDNSLFYEGRLQGIVDFEEVCRGPSLLDVAMTTIACCFRATPPGYQDTTVAEDKVAAILRGYHAMRPFTAEERALFGEYLTLACLVISFWRFRNFNVRKAQQSSETDKAKYLEMQQRATFIRDWEAGGALKRHFESLV